MNENHAATCHCRTCLNDREFWAEAFGWPQPDYSPPEPQTVHVDAWEALSSGGTVPPMSAAIARAAVDGVPETAESFLAGLDERPGPVLRATLLATIAEGRSLRLVKLSTPGYGIEQLRGIAWVRLARINSMDEVCDVLDAAGYAQGNDVFRRHEVPADALWAVPLVRRHGFRQFQCQRG